MPIINISNKYSKSMFNYPELCTTNLNFIWLPMLRHSVNYPCVQRILDFVYFYLKSFNLHIADINKLSNYCPCVIFKRKFLFVKFCITTLIKNSKISKINVDRN